MRTIKKIFLINLFLCCSLILSQKICLSADWHYLFTNNGVKFYVDIDGIKIDRKKGNMVVWQKQIHSNGASYVSMELVNYKEKSYTTIQLTEYGPDGNVKYSGPADSQLKYIIPDSAFEITVKMILQITGIN